MIETVRTDYRGGLEASPTSSAAMRRPAVQAFWVLYVGYIALPVFAGIDKFCHVLVNWDMYLAPRIAEMLPVSGHTFMLAVGVIEIAAGLLVALYPRIGGWVVALWLWGIILNLLMVPGFYDIALRDFGLSLGAIALARLASETRFPQADVKTTLRNLQRSPQSGLCPQPISGSPSPLRGGG